MLRESTSVMLDDTVGFEGPLQIGFDILMTPTLFVRGVEIRVGSHG